MKANLSNFQYSQAADFLSPVFSLPITHSGHLQLFSATCSANALTTPPSSFLFADCATTTPNHPRHSLSLNHIKI